MENKFKARLKRRGKEIYLKYFFNPNETIDYVINQIDNNQPIDNALCQVVIDVPISYQEQIYELIKYYPNKLREIKFINEQVVTELYSTYGNTINIMNTYKGIKNVRGKICDSANKRAKEKSIEFAISNEDIVLVENCPLLNIPLEYGNNKPTNFSASIDRIDSTKGYIKGNIQIISMLANSMKSNANPEQLRTFANNIINLYH